MVEGIYNGKTVHSFFISNHYFYVIRGSMFIAAMRGNTVCVLAPKGMSYHQAAIEANRARKEGKFIPDRHLSTKAGEPNDF